MSEESVRVWFVDRAYTDKGLLTVTYATPDGERAFDRQQSPTAPAPSAARTVDPADLATVDDPDRVDRYRDEVARMRDRHDPDDSV